MISANRPQLADHAESFRCIGPACEDTCCAGWQVTIDRKTFARYRAMTGSPLYPLLGERVVEYPDSKSDDDFGRVRLDPGHRCPFLSPERLCVIQSEHGAEALSATCAEYPRVVRWIDSRKEVSLSLSCPEAARTMLLDDNLLAALPANRRKAYRSFAAGAAQLASAGGDPLQYFWPVRQLTFLLLSDRRYPLWQRLLVLGMLCRRLAAPHARGLVIPELLQSYAEIMAEEKLRAAMDGITPRLEAQLSMLVHLLNTLRRMTALPSRFLECLDDCFHGLACRAGEAVNTAAYQDACTRYFAPFAAGRESMFENYLLSYLVRNRFPYGDDRQPEPSGGPLMEFTLMALRFALIKGVLIGMAAFHKENLAPSHMIQLVQSFEKGVEHSAPARAALADCIQLARLDSPDGIAMMLRN